MVYIRLPTWKTALQPSAKHTFDQAGNYTRKSNLYLSTNLIFQTLL